MATEVILLKFNYTIYAARDKKAADKYSARPGYSEHQTGLTFDIGGVNSDKTYMQVSEKQKKVNGLRKMHINTALL